MAAGAPLALTGPVAYLGRIMAKKPENKNYKVIAENRRARYDYAIESDLEVGIMLHIGSSSSLTKSSPDSPHVVTSALMAVNCIQSRRNDDD